MYTPRILNPLFYSQNTPFLQRYLSPSQARYEDIVGARKHLNNLCNEYNQLIHQDFEEIKNVMSNSTQAILELQQTEQQYLHRLTLRQNNLQSLQKTYQHFQRKLIQGEEELNSVQELNGQVSTNMEEKHQAVKKHLNHNQQLILEKQKEQQHLEQTQNIQTQLLAQIRTAQENQRDTQNNLQQLNQQAEQLQNQNNQLSYECQCQTLQIENLQLRLTNEAKTQLNYQQKIQIYNQQIQKNMDNTHLFKSESLTQQNISKLIQLSSLTVNEIQNQLNTLKDQNKNLQQNIQIQSLRKEQIDQENKKKQKKIQQLKEKNNIARKILNQIFEEDSHLIQMIASKKVHPTNIQHSLINIKEQDPVQVPINHQQIPINHQQIPNKQQQMPIKQQQIQQAKDIAEDIINQYLTNTLYEKISNKQINNQQEVDYQQQIDQQDQITDEQQKHTEIQNIKERNMDQVNTADDFYPTTTTN